MKIAPALTSAVLALTGCRAAAVDASGPRTVLAAYARALEEGRATDAHRLLSDDARRSVSLHAFERMVRESPEEMKEIARALTRPAEPPLVTARVQTAAGEPLDLILENGTWAIDGLALDRYGQSTPRQALLGFLSAYERQRFDVLMRYIPDGEREGAPEGWSSSRETLTAERLRAAWTGPQRDVLDTLVRAVRAAMPSATIEATQDRAAMTYGVGGTVSFVRERGLWKIANLK